MESIIQLVLSLGFKEDGATKIVAHGVATAHSAANVALVGGRVRFRKGNQFITVGKKTTCVYIKENGQVSQMVNFETKDVERITKSLTTY